MIGPNALVSKVRRVFSSDPGYFTDINISISCKPDENGVNKDFLHLWSLTLARTPCFYQNFIW